MGILEQIVEMKGKGSSEEEIAKKLQESGTSPKEISDAMSQARIKSAVSSENGMAQSTQETSSNRDGMEPSMMGLEAPESNEDPGELPTENISDEDLMPPSPSTLEKMRRGPVTRELGQEESQEEYSPRAPEYFNNQYPKEESQEEYSQGYAYPQAQMGDPDTMIEIAEQVFFEKIKSIQKQVEDFSEFKTLSQVKLDNISDRLRRIESHIDRLQAEILEKVGSYGRGIEGVKKEMEMMQDSFGKMVNNIADKNEHHHQTHATSQSHAPNHTNHTLHKTHKAKSNNKSKAKKKK